MSADIGRYNKDPERYKVLVEELYEKYPSITLPPEYAQLIQENLSRFLIRLARYKFVARLCRKTDHLLEVGCGSGLGTIFLGQQCARVVGLDVKGSELEEARSINRRSNVEFRNGDVFSYLPSEKFDVVASLDVIEHMSEDQGRRFVRALIPHLNLNGMVVIGTPSVYSYPYQSPLSQASHVKCYDREELVAILDDSFGRVLAFSMNDEIVHTGSPQMAWYYFIVAFNPKI